MKTAKAEEAGDLPHDSTAVTGKTRIRAEPIDESTNKWMHNSGYTPEDSRRISSRGVMASRWTAAPNY